VSEEPAPGDDVGPVEASEAALALLRSSADAMIDPQVLFEAVRDSDGRVVDFLYRMANRAALSYLGLDESELIGRSARTSLPNLEGSGLLGRYAPCLSDGQPVVLDDFTYFSGTLRDERTRGELLVDRRRYDIRATKAGANLLWLTWSDVTESFQTLERIAAAERIYRLLAEHSGDVITHTRECDDGDNEIVWISPNVEAVLGRPVEYWLGRRWLELLSPEDAEAAAARWASASSVGDTNHRAQFKTADGVVHWFRVQTTPFYDDEGQRDGAITSFRLVDDEVAAEQAVEEARRQQVKALTGAEFLEADLKNFNDVLEGRIDSYRMIKQYVHAMVISSGVTCR
jgi:PAS domain S-box-containing protein